MKKKIVIIILIFSFNNLIMAQEKVKLDVDTTNNFKKKEKKNYNPFIISSNSVGWKTFKGYLFGGYTDGKWYQLDEFKINKNKRIDLVSGKEVFKICSIDKMLGDYSWKYPIHSIDYSAGERFDTFNYPVEQYDEYNLIVGTSGDWNPLPRIPKKNKDGTEYIIDIDGDGVVEKFVLEKSNDNSNINNWYIETKKKKSIVFEGSEMEWVEFMFADLNGDNVIELIYIGGAHWISMGIMEYKNNEFQFISSLYIGD